MVNQKEQVKEAVEQTEELAAKLKAETPEQAEIPDQAEPDEDRDFTGSDLWSRLK